MNSFVSLKSLDNIVYYSEVYSILYDKAMFLCNRVNFCFVYQIITYLWDEWH